MAKDDIPDDDSAEPEWAGTGDDPAEWARSEMLEALQLQDPALLAKSFRESEGIPRDVALKLAKLLDPPTDNVVRLVFKNRKGRPKKENEAPLPDPVLLAKSFRKSKSIPRDVALTLANLLDPPTANAIRLVFKNPRSRPKKKNKVYRDLVIRTSMRFQYAHAGQKLENLVQDVAKNRKLSRATIFRAGVSTKPKRAPKRK